MKKKITVSAIFLLLVMLAWLFYVQVQNSLHCKNGLCIYLELEEPVFLNQPAQIKITIKTKEAKSNLRVFLSRPGDTSIFQPQREWIIDLEPNQPVVLTSTLIIPSGVEGWLGFSATAFDPAGSWITLAKDLRIKNGSVTVNPPPERNPGDKLIPEPAQTMPPDTSLHPTP